MRPSESVRSGFSSTCLILNLDTLIWAQSQWENMGVWSAVSLKECKIQVGFPPKTEATWLQAQHQIDSKSYKPAAYIRVCAQAWGSAAAYVGGKKSENCLRWCHLSLKTVHPLPGARNSWLHGQTYVSDKRSTCGWAAFWMFHAPGFDRVEERLDGKRRHPVL